MTLYLDNAATSFPKPPVVAETLRRHLEQEGACPGRGAYAMARRSSAAVDDTRALLARLFNAPDPANIVFAFNATDALNMAIKGALSEGDHVVTTVMEHNSVTRPLNRLEKEGYIQVTRVPASPEGWVSPEAIRRALRPMTRLVAVVHGSNASGSLQSLQAIGAIAREYGPWFLVDAAQTAGCVPIDVQEDFIDLLAFPGHKALLGLAGTGGLYVGPRVRLGPWREGGTGIRSEDPLQPEELPHALEAGSANTIGLAALGDSVRWILQEGVDRIRAHELSLMERLFQGLSPDDRFTLHGPKDCRQRIAVLSLSIRGCAPQAVADFLDSRHAIAVRAGLHCAPGAHRVMGTFPEGTVRISPGYFNTLEDMDRCVEALRAAADAPQRGKASPVSRTPALSPDGG